MRRRQTGSAEQQNSTVLVKRTRQGIGGNDSTNNRRTIDPFSMTALEVAGVVGSIAAIWGSRRGRPRTSCRFHGTTDKQPTNNTQQPRLANYPNVESFPRKLRNPHRKTQEELHAERPFGESLTRYLLRGDNAACKQTTCHE